MNRANYANIFSVEPLDPRRLLSAEMSGSQLIITGTEGPDHVLIRVDPANSDSVLVNVNGEKSTFIQQTLSGIVVDLKGGRDNLVVQDLGHPLGVPMTVLGGGGADFLMGGSANDVIIGGPGRDRITGGDGDDLLSGGSSRDIVAGGGDNDTILGGSGDDALDGGTGDDSLAGGKGDDHVTGDDGSDLIAGNGDSDQLIGGTGNDSIGGGRGDDDVDGGAGSDDLTGGGGDDAFAKGDNADEDVITDKTLGADREYTPVTLDFVPPNYQDLFHHTFPNSVPLGVRVNDDHTFDLLYQYQGDGTTYHAYFTFTGNRPFDNLEGVDLVKYEVAPANVPPLTLAAFRASYPDAVIKEVFADHDGDAKFALIRMQNGDGETQWVHADWLDGD